MEIKTKMSPSLFRSLFNQRIGARESLTEIMKHELDNAILNTVYSILRQG